jgi:hypothetical protein
MRKWMLRASAFFAFSAFGFALFSATNGYWVGLLTSTLLLFTNLMLFLTWKRLY